MDSNAVSNFNAIRKEVITTTNTLGWRLMQQIAERVVASMVDEAISEDDEVRGSNKRREAKAAREFWNRYLTTIQATREADTETVENEFFEF